MLLRLTPTRPVTLKGARGRARVYGNHGLLRVTVTGRFGRELAGRALGEMSAQADAMGEFRLFLDVREMTGFEAASRLACADWCAGRLGALDAVHVLRPPGLVALGLAAATLRLTLGRTVETHRHPHSFERAYQRSLRGEWRWTRRQAS